MRKLIFSLLFVFSASNFCFSAPQLPSVLKTEDILRIEEKFNIAGKNIEYLKSRQIDCTEYNEKLKYAEKLYYDLRFSGQIQDFEIAKELLAATLTEIISSSQKDAAFARRMDLMYQIMVVMGMAIIIIMVSYSVYMYSRRK